MGPFTLHSQRLWSVSSTAKCTLAAYITNNIDPDQTVPFGTV